MASLSGVLSFLGGSGNGHSGSKPFKNKNAALEALFAETEKNLEALAGNTPLSSAAFDRLNGQLDLLQDQNGTVFALQNAYGQVHGYVGRITMYEQLPAEEKAKHQAVFMADLTVRQAELSETLVQLRGILKRAYGNS